jgi:hypothetical protein
MVNGKVMKKLPTPRVDETVDVCVNQGRLQKDPRPWPNESRRAGIALKERGELGNPIATQLITEKAIPAARTVRRHQKRFRDLGNILPFKRSGNKKATVLRGPELVLLATFVQMYPKAQTCKKVAFLWNAFGRNMPVPRFYVASQITRAEQMLGISRKCSSTTARQAFTATNILRRHHFWHSNHPLGIADIKAEDMIDIDEAKLILEQSNRRHGKCAIERRCRETGNYGHGC